MEDEAYHFSISHCSDYAAAIVSRWQRVGVDIEVPTNKVEKIKHKFLSEEEWEPLYSHWLKQNKNISHAEPPRELLTLLWSSKEAMFKWWGLGDVDFRTMLHLYILKETNGLQLNGTFEKGHMHITFPVSWKNFQGLLLAWVATAPDGQTVLAVGPN